MGRVIRCIFAAFARKNAAATAHAPHAQCIIFEIKKVAAFKILHLDSNHPLLRETLDTAGFDNYEDFTSSKENIQKIIGDYHGIVLRSRFAIDREFIGKATNLRFIARVGAGLENIDCDYATSQGIALIAAPEGNRNAVGEHTLAMLLALLNKLHTADREIREGYWNREKNRGYELDGKTVGIIGYGNMGRAFARKLRGFDVNLICHDIKSDVGDNLARQVPLAELQRTADIVSLHLPWTPLTNGMINREFIESFAKPFWLVNTSRGKNVITADLASALESGKVLGAALDVLEFEKSSFEHLFDQAMPDSFKYLLASDKVLLSPHVAGWSFESHKQLARVVAEKIIAAFGNG